MHHKHFLTAQGKEIIAAIRLALTLENENKSNCEALIALCNKFELVSGESFPEWQQKVKEMYILLQIAACIMTTGNKETADAFGEIRAKLKPIVKLETFFSVNPS